MCNFGGGQTSNTSGTTFTDSTTSGSTSGVSSTTPDPLAGLAYQQVLSNAAQIANTPYQPYQGQQVAGFTPDQIAAMQGVRNMQGIQTPYINQAQNLYGQSLGYLENPLMAPAVGLYGQSLNYASNPNMQMAQGYTNQSLQNLANPFLGQTQQAVNSAYGQIANPLMGQTQDLSGQSVNLSNIENYNQQALNRYMNPYQQSVVDATLAQMKQNQDVLQNQNTARAIQQGAYGGSGQFMGQAELGRQQALANAQTLAQLNASNYQQAMGQYNQQQGQAIQARQQAAQLLGQLGNAQADRGVNAYMRGADVMGNLGAQEANRAVQGYQNAAQLMGNLGQSQAELGLRAYQGAAQGLGSLGSDQQRAAISAIQNAAQGIAGLGSQAQTGSLQDLQALLATGGQQQQLSQQQLDKAYDQWQQARAYPYQQTSYFAGLAQGLGPLMGQYGTQAGTSTSHTTGTEIGNKQTQSSGGGGGLMGLITAGLGAASALKDGGVVKHRELGGPLTKVGDLPYGQGPIDLKAGFGSLINKTPFADAPDNYIAESEKAGKVLKPAKELAAEKLQSQINKALGLIPEGKKLSAMDLGEDSSSESSSDSSGLGDLAKKAIGLYNKWDSGSGTASSGGLDFGSAGNALSDFGSSISNIFSADGGRVGKADGGGYYGQYLKSKQAKDQAQQILADYRNTLGRNAEQGGFDYWAARAAEGQTPEQRAQDFYNSPERMGQVRANYVDILDRAGEPAGIDYWQNRAKQGMSFGDMQRDFKNSIEGRAIAAKRAATPFSTGWSSLDPSGGLNKALARERLIDPMAKPMSNYDMLLQQARQRNPGPQLTPEQQGMPGMPGPRYYTGEEGFGGLEPYVSATSDRGLAKSLGLPEKASVTQAPNIYESADSAHNAALGNIQREQVGLAYGFAGMGVNPAIATVMAVQATQGKVDQANREWEAARAAIDAERAKNPPPEQTPAQKFGLSQNYQDYVNSAYNSYLGRDPTNDEMNKWLGDIASGKNPAEVEKSIQASPEASSIDQIQNMYRSQLGRNADPGGLSYWRDQVMNKGLSLGDLQKQFRQSQEYTSTPEMFRSNAPVQGYFTSIDNTQFNPETGLFNLKYTAPYRGSAPQYNLSSAQAQRDALLQGVQKKLTDNLPTKASGGRIGKAGGGGLSGKSLYDYLISIGANPKEAAMLTGNAKVESSFNPYVMHDNNTGYGLWGHGKDRWADMRKFTGQSKPGWEDQAKFALWELRNSPKTAAARNALAKADDARGVAIAGMHFERPAGYRADAPWAGKNWAQRFQNVASLMGGKDIGSGSALAHINPADPSGPLLGTPSSGVGTPQRRSLLARIVNALSPISSAEAAESQPASASGSKSMLAWPTLRNPKMNNLPDALGMNKPTLPDWKQEVKTGFGPLQGDKPVDVAQILAQPSTHANMGPEMPEETPLPPRRPTDLGVSAEDQDGKGKKYWGDWRDAAPWSSDPIGGFFDDLLGEKKKADKPGKWDSNESIDLGNLLGFASGGVVRHAYADGGGEDNPLEALGAAIEGGFGDIFGGGESSAAGQDSGGLFGDLFGGGEESVPTKTKVATPAQEEGGGLGDLLGSLFGGGGGGNEVVAQDRAAPQHQGFLPPAVSQALIAAGLGMMASPRSNTFQAMGEGGLRGFQVYQEATAQEQKRAEAAAKERAAEEYAKRLTPGVSAEDEGDEGATPDTKKESLIKKFDEIASIPATTPQQIQQKNAALRTLQTQIKMSEEKQGKIGVIGKNVFGDPEYGWTSGPKAGQPLTKAEAEQADVPKPVSEPGLEAPKKEKGEGPDEDYLSTLPPEKQDYIRGIARGENAPPAGVAGTKIKEIVKRYDPTWNEDKWRKRREMTRAYEPQGKIGQQMNTASNALDHADRLMELTERLDNFGGWGTPLNIVKNKLAGKKGEAIINDFTTNRSALIGEMEKYFKGGTPAEAQVKRALEELDINSSPQQISAAVNAAVELIQTKTKNYRKDWEIEFGPVDKGGVKFPHDLEENDRVAEDVRQRYYKLNPDAKKYDEEKKAAKEKAPEGKTIARVGKSKSTGKKIIEYTDGSREYAD